MPFLRFSRDKRGYESTYLCHTYRRGGTPQLRVLYWFRTPPDVRVGRLALDPEAIRAIEEANPDLKFDWDKILKVKPPPPPPDYDREGREERQARRRRKAASEAERAVADEPDLADESEAQEGPEPEGEAPEADTRHVVLGLLDENGLARLRARHASIVARIDERPREPEQLEALRAKAALIDPDAWTTVAEARERLATLDEATETLRAALGRRRRSRRGGRHRRRRPVEPEAGAAPAGGESVPSAEDTPTPEPPDPDADQGES